MNTSSIFTRLCFSAISRRAAVLLLALALSSLASCGRKHDTSAGGDSGTGEIYDAAKAGDVEKLKALLKGNPNLVSSRATNGMTALHWAANSGHKDTAELLLANKAEVNAKNDIVTTPLHFAAQGHKDVVELLLANKAEVNAKNDIGLTPLHFFLARPTYPLFVFD